MKHIFTAIKSRINKDEEEITMDKLRRAIEAFAPSCEQERRDRELLLSAIDRLDTPLTRENPFAHFSATGYFVFPRLTSAAVAVLYVRNTFTLLSLSAT